MYRKSYSAISSLRGFFQGVYDACEPAIPYGATTAAVALFALHFIALAVRVPFVEISSVHALMTCCLWSMMLMIERKSWLDTVLSVAVVSVLNVALWNWMIAQSDVQTAFDIRTSVMQIMLVSGYMGFFVYLNRGCLRAFGKKPHA